MKAFLAALAIMAAIAIGADLYMDSLSFSSADTYTTLNVRLGDCAGLAVTDREPAVDCLPAK